MKPHKSSARQLRQDEKFVISAIASFYSCTWRPGEDPPDAYLTCRNEIVGVEISRLTQHVRTTKGGSHARLSDDMPALEMADELDLALRDTLPSGRLVVLTLNAPILEVSKTRNRLKARIPHLVAATVKETEDFDETICGNRIGIRVATYTSQDGRKLHALVTNSNSSSHILSNAWHILEERIAQKAAACRHLVGPLWLALLNDYWLASEATYKEAIRQISAPHPFARILLVSGNGSVTVLI
jgi:hypothetical protein